MSATLADADVLIQNMKWQDLALMDLLPTTCKHGFRVWHVRLIGSEFDQTVWPTTWSSRLRADSCP